MQVRRHLDNPRGKKAADVGIKLENQFAMEAKALRTGLKATWARWRSWTRARTTT
jgi:hypothetical protein